jgi:hypothetical protein
MRVLPTSGKSGVSRRAVRSVHRARRSSILLGLVTTGLEPEVNDRAEIEARLRELQGLARSMDEDIIPAFAHHAESRCRSRFGDVRSAVASLESSVRLWTNLGWPVELMNALVDPGEVQEGLETTSVLRMR